MFNICRNCWLWNHGCADQPESCNQYDPIFTPDNEEDADDK